MGTAGIDIDTGDATKETKNVPDPSVSESITIPSSDSPVLIFSHPRQPVCFVCGSIPPACEVAGANPAVDMLGRVLSRCPVVMDSLTSRVDVTALLYIK